MVIAKYPWQGRVGYRRQNQNNKTDYWKFNMYADYYCGCVLPAPLWCSADVHVAPPAFLGPVTQTSLCLVFQMCVSNNWINKRMPQMCESPSICLLPAPGGLPLGSSAEYLGWPMRPCSSLADYRPALQTTWTPTGSAAPEADAYSSPDAHRNRHNITAFIKKIIGNISQCVWLYYAGS